jgi:hypothetical protein
MKEKKGEFEHAVWVMTIDKKWETIKFWDPYNAWEKELPGRILAEHVDNLKGYLNPEPLPKAVRAEMNKILDW